MIRGLLGRFLRSLLWTLLPDIEKPERLLDRSIAENNHRVVLARIWGVKEEFHRDYIRFTRQCLVEQYARRGTTLNIRKAKQDKGKSKKTTGAKYILYSDKEPGLWMMWVTTRAVNKRLKEYFLVRMNELTGRSEEEIKIVLDRVSRTMIMWKSPSNKAIKRIAEVWGRYTRYDQLLDQRLMRLLLTAIDCEQCDYDVSDTERWLEIHGTLGYESDAIVHILICQAERRKRLQAVFESKDFIEQARIEGTLPPTLGSTWSRRVVYTLKDLENLCQLINNKDLSVRNLLNSLEYYGVIFPPQDYPELKELIEGGDSIEPWRVAAYYHQRVRISHIRSVHSFVNSGKVSFYDARMLARAGVLPELAEIVPENWGVGEIISLHKLVERFGLEAVQDSLWRFQNDFREIVSYWSLRTRYPELNWEEISEKIKEQKVEAVETNGYRQTVKVSTKRRTQIVEAVKEVEELVISETVPVDIGIMRYRGVSVHQLPKLNGRRWFRLLQSCGWDVVEYKASSHARLRKGNWTIGYYNFGAKPTSRYTLYDSFRQARVPEDEVRLIVDTWNGRIKY